jgi:hypothetical protein
MAMTWSSLTGSKGSAGSIMTWVNYSKLSVDVQTILDEAQALLFTLLRTREMRTMWRFTIPINGAKIALPTGFLDPIGTMYCPSIDARYFHKDESFIQNIRVFNEVNGNLGSNPFTTTSGSNLVTVHLANHGFSQDSDFYTNGATAFNGVTISGTFPIDSITDTNNFVIDITSLGTTPSGSGAGGGSGTIAYTCEILQIGSAQFWAIWDEFIHFDFAFDTQQTLNLLYYKSPTLLSSTNQSNWLTNRYPFLLRQACITQAADWMKEKDEYQKDMQTLTAMVQKVSEENDMGWRGAEIDTETP